MSNFKYLNKPVLSINFMQSGDEKWFQVFHCSNYKLNYQTDDVEDLVQYLYDLLEEEVLLC